MSKIDDFFCTEESSILEIAHTKEAKRKKKYVLKEKLHIPREAKNEKKYVLKEKLHIPREAKNEKKYVPKEKLHIL